MTFSTFVSEEAHSQRAKVAQFCAPIHICELIDHLLLPATESLVREKNL